MPEPAAHKLFWGELPAGAAASTNDFTLDYFPAVTSSLAAGCLQQTALLLITIAICKYGGVLINAQF